MTTINFTQSATPSGQPEWVSDPILLTGVDIALHVEMERKGLVKVLRSITGDKYVESGSFSSDNDGVAESNLTGGLDGQYIKLKVYSEPSLAGYIE